MLTNRHGSKSASVGGSSHGRRGSAATGWERAGAGGDRAGAGVNDVSGRSGVPGFPPARIRGAWLRQECLTLPRARLNHSVRFGLDEKVCLYCSDNRQSLATRINGDGSVELPWSMPGGLRRRRGRWERRALTSSRLPSSRGLCRRSGWT